VIVGRVHPDLIAERTQPPADAKAWDRPLVAIVAVVGPLAMLLVAGLEQRYRAGPAGFSTTALLGLVMAGVRGAVANWAVYANRFFSGLVRIQTDRGHRVVDTGPYAVIRHPGYAGSLVTNFGAAAALESWAALAVVCVIIRSRWITPCRCAAARPSAISVATVSACSSGSGPFRRRSASVSPARCSMTRNIAPSCSPTSWIVQMCG
jgi:protein-S-isoprenylcysteine O-methyltransferase Ste14